MSYIQLQLMGVENLLLLLLIIILWCCGILLRTWGIIVNKTDMAFS